MKRIIKRIHGTSCEDLHISRQGVLSREYPFKERDYYIPRVMIGPLPLALLHTSGAKNSEYFKPLGGNLFQRYPKEAKGAKTVTRHVHDWQSFHMMQIECD